jgi:putative acetyltransferase
MRAGVDLADNWLNLTRLELEVYTDNEAAIRLYERFGFEVEGTLRQHAFRDGQYVDSHMMGRLRPAR